MVTPKFPIQISLQSYSWIAIPSNKDVRLINPPPSSWKSDPKFQIEIKNGNQARTSTKRAWKKGDNSCVIWDESFVFTSEPTEDTLLTFTVIRTHRLIPDTIIGSSEGRVTELLKTQSPCKLDVDGKCHITFKIETTSDVTSEVVEQALTTLGNLSNLKVPAKVVNPVIIAEQVYKDNEKTWSSFIDKFEVFVGVIDEISEISPYVKVAWSVLSVIPKTIIAKKNRDDRIKQLCDKLKDVYDYIMDSKRLSELTNTQSKTLSAVVRQTTECAYYIRAYCTEDTVNNTLKGIFGSADDKIRDFNQSFDRLIKNMKSSVNLQTSIVTLRVEKGVSELIGLHLLKDMRYNGTPPLPGKQCLPGTRRRLIDDILKRINDDASPQILVVSGPAGVGKSAIAHTIAGIFKEQNRLGSMFRFDRSFPNRRSCLFSTISRDLADGDVLWRKELVENITPSIAVREIEDPETQFNEFIIKPSQNAEITGPVFIVVDALDESGDRNEREVILEILLGRWSELPKNYRLMVTTRPEQDIEAQCQKFDIPCIRMGDIDAEETYRDIEAYVLKRLDSISSILNNIDGNWHNILAERAEGLFQWAQTVCEFINPTITRSQLVKKKWKTCISNSSSSLYGLYRQIISSQAEVEDKDFVEDFKTIVGAIIIAQKPLSIDALQNIFDDIGDIKSILTPFGSFFVGVHDPLTPVRPVHTSLFDFFISKKIAKEINEYYIDTSDQSRMTLGCLKVMNRMLCFNICQLKTSHLLNKEVPDFDAVEKFIPLHLSYSSHHWIDHLQSSPVSEELIREIRRLMDHKLLYYFEALSLLNTMYLGCETVLKIVDWCKDSDDGLAADAIDAWRFGEDFEYIMRESTPHIYLSALPFTPRDSFVSKKYLDKYTGLFTFDIGQPVGPSPPSGIAQRVSSDKIAFSPNDTCIATQSDRGEFLLWNYMTGEHLAYVKFGRDDRHASSSWISDIVYSFDGEFVYCCFLDGDILVWNTGTKETKIERYEEMVGAEYYCCCTISSDGRFIVQLGEEVLVFDRKSRQIVKRFGEEYSFSAISPNGNWIALKEIYGYSVYIWDTGNQKKHCVIPVNDDVNNLSLTDNYIAVFQTDFEVQIWDVQTITELTDIRHGKPIESLCLSPDDQYLLVTSRSMYSIWSVSMGELISRFYVDDLSYCLGFSHDSKSIALYTRNNTLRVQQWVKSVESNDPRGNGLRSVHAIWLRGSYLILYYQSILDEHRLQISDVTTTNSIIFEAGLEDNNPVSVAPGRDEENVHVAYISHRAGLCLWDDKEGEIVVDESVRSITALLCLDNYLISGRGKTINMWDIRTKMTRGPIDLPYELKSLLPVRGTRFAVIYDDEMEIHNCDSDNNVGKTFAFRSFLDMDSYLHWSSRYSPTAVSANEEHFIFMSERGVYILDSTGVNMNLISPPDYRGKKSLNGKYMAWIDNGDIKLFDVDTEKLLVGPSFDHPVKDFWLSDDSKYIITASPVGDDWWGPISLDIWDIQSENMITKTVQFPFFPKTAILDMSRRRLVVIPEGREDCYVWDLDKCQIMSSVYNARQLADDGSDIEGTSISSKKETLDYASMGWEKASLLTFPEVKDRSFTGWVLGSQGERLFWVPEKMRLGFWFSCTTHTPHRNATKLNFTNFVHGSDWTKCKSGND